MNPVTLNLVDRRCLVVGGGAVAQHKVLGLLREGAHVTVVAPHVIAELEEQASTGQVVLEKREYRSGEAGGYALVIAATSERAVNRQVFEDGEKAGVWVNVADDPELCSFHLPARVRRGLLEIAIGSGGTAPFATSRMRQLLETRFGPEWADWAEAAAGFREAARARSLPEAERNAVFDRFFAGTVDSETLRARVPSHDETEAWLASGKPPAGGNS